MKFVDALALALELKAKQGDRILRERYSSFLSAAAATSRSPSPDAQRVKLTPARMEAAKRSFGETLQRLRERKPVVTRHMKLAQTFVRRAVRMGKKPKMKMPDGPLGSLYVRVGRGKTVRFADHAAPLGWRNELPKRMRDKVPAVSGSNSDQVPVGGFSSKLGRRHGPAAVSVVVRRNAGGRVNRDRGDSPYSAALALLRGRR